MTLTRGILPLVGTCETPWEKDSPLEMLPVTTPRSEVQKDDTYVSAEKVDVGIPIHDAGL